MAGWGVRYDIRNVLEDVGKVERVTLGFCNGTWELEVWGNAFGRIITLGNGERVADGLGFLRAQHELGLIPDIEVYGLRSNTVYPDPVDRKTADTLQQYGLLGFGN